MSREPSAESLTPPYQRTTCTLPIMMRLAILSEKQSPCAGCNEDRATCGGEPKEARRPGASS